MASSASDNDDDDDDARRVHAAPPRPARPSAGVTVAALFVYPIKSCKAVPVQHADVALNGFRYDRHWMVVTEDTHAFVTQRQHPAMCLIEPTIDSAAGLLRLAAPGRTDVGVPLEPSDRQKRQTVQVKVWRDTVEGIDAGDEVARWLSEYLHSSVRLVSKGDSVRRLNPKRTPPRELFDHEPQTAFSDGYPFLILSEASVADLNGRMQSPATARNFRPNIVVTGCVPFEEDTWKVIRVGSHRLHVVSRCTRCTITRVDPDTGTMSMPTLPTLMKYRCVEAASPGSPCFGVNACHEVLGGLIAVGDPVDVVETQPLG